MKPVGSPVETNGRAGREGGGDPKRPDRKWLTEDEQTQIKNRRR